MNFSDNDYTRKQEVRAVAVQAASRVVASRNQSTRFDKEDILDVAKALAAYIQNGETSE